METIRIKNIKQLAEYKDKLDDEKFLAETRFDLSECESIKIHIEGAHFDSSINSNIMRAFVLLQDEIYREYAFLEYGKRNKSKLSIYEKDALKLYVKVDKGSTIITLTLPNLVDPIMKSIADKTKNEIFRNKGLIITAKILVTVFCVILENYIIPGSGLVWSFYAVSEVFLKELLSALEVEFAKEMVSAAMNGNLISKEKIKEFSEKIKELIRNKKHKK